MAVRQPPLSTAAALLLLLLVAKTDAFVLKASPSRAPSATTTRMAASMDAPAAGRIKQPLGFRVADAVVGGLFAVDPLFNAISKQARKSIKGRADSMGFSWDGLVDDLKRNAEALEAEYEKVARPDAVALPDYYQKPFHAYKQGNLCWDAAMEVEAAAYAVHSNIYTGSPKTLEKEGDSKLRGNFVDRMVDMLREYHFTPKRILDVGSSTGLSTLKLQATFPTAEICGIDLSPYMLAVARHNLRTRPEQAQAARRVQYIHAAGEDTGMPDASIDMVSICLVNHELPNDAARAVFREAHRVLVPGGCLSFMDMNPLSPSFQRITRNPLLFALFKSTEPWLQEYVQLDLEAELHASGFSKVGIRENSPRHRTVVAFK